MLPIAHAGHWVLWLLYAVPVVALYLFVSKRYGFRFHGGIKA